jgi:hypothetical protein
MARQRFKPDEVITALSQAKGMTTVAARLLGCVPNTVQAYIDRYPAVAEARAQEREGMTDVAELALYKAIQSGEAWAVCFYLKTQGKGRGYVERVEQQHSGSITQEHTGAVEIQAVDYRHSIRALRPPDPEDAEAAG